MKAIILAAGQGTRLRPLTNSMPKCLVELNGQTLLDHQIRVLQSEGVNDIHLVGGYRVSQIDNYNVTLHMNEHYAATNMVKTLFCAEDQFDGSSDLIISYGDIVYESRVLNTLLKCSAPICLSVDREWKRYWQARMDDPLTDAETLKLTSDFRITELGKKPLYYDDIQGQYIGLIKVRADFICKLFQAWQQMDKSALYDGMDFGNMYMTSFLQYLIDRGWHIQASLIDNGWLEIDTLSDLELSQKFSFLDDAGLISIKSFF